MGAGSRMSMFLIGILFAIVFGGLAVVQAIIIMSNILGWFATATILGGIGFVLIVVAIYGGGD